MTSNFFRAVAAGIALFSVVSCNSVLDMTTKSSAQKKGQVTLAFAPNEAGSRTIAPALPSLSSFSALLVPLDGQNGGESLQLDPITSPAELSLDYGTWDIEIAGFDGSHTLAAQGNTTIDVVEGSNNVDIILAPSWSGGGDGFLDVTYTWSPSAADSAAWSLRAYADNTVELVGTAPVATIIDVGAGSAHITATLPGDQRYLLVLELQRGSKIVGATAEVVSISSGRISNATKALTVSRPPTFVYATTRTTNNIHSVPIDTETGLLGAKNFISVTLPTKLVADPLGRFLFVINDATTKSITPASIDPLNGTLTLKTAILAGSTALNDLVVDPSGRFLYVADAAGWIRQYSINQLTGELTPLTPSFVGAGVLPLSLAIRDRMLYCGNYDGNTGPNGIQAFPILASGALDTPTTGPAVTLVNGIAAVGDYLYFSDENGAGEGSIALDPVTGRLGPVVSFDNGPIPAPDSFAVDPWGKTLYRVYSGAGTIISLALQPDGNVFGRTFQQGPYASTLAFEPSGRFLVGAISSNYLKVYGVDHDTALLDTARLPLNLGETVTSLTVVTLP